jgi:Cysteine-rich CPCC
MTSQFGCPCCGFLTLDEMPPGTFTICPVCWWEDDDMQARDLDYAGGANAVSLRQAQDNFRRFAVSDKKFIECVRLPRAHEYPGARPAQ